MSILSPHPHVVKGTVPPPMSYLERYIIKDPTHGHWFWHDAPKTHRFNVQGHALVSTRRKKGRSVFTVARLLITYAMGTLPPRTRIEPLCPLPQCINPAHWRPVFKPAPWRLALAPDAPWQLIWNRSGEPAARTVVVNIEDSNTVHVVAVTEKAPLVAMCGHPINAHRAVVVERGATCTQGC